MSSSSIAHLDSKGRVIIPAAYREILNLKENSNVLLSVNSEKKMIVILPFATAGDDLYRVVVELSDAPGSLSGLLSLLARDGVDLIQSESIAPDRGRRAQWKAIVDLSKCKIKPHVLEGMLTREKVVTSVNIEKI
jgi:AbrB family looped-hinge helix DNA binding protein